MKRCRNNTITKCHSKMKLKKAILSLPEQEKLRKQSLIKTLLKQTVYVPSIVGFTSLTRKCFSKSFSLEI